MDARSLGTIPERAAWHRHQAQSDWDVLLAEGLRWRKQESWFGERVDPDFAAKKGAIEQLYSAPPEGSAVICTDQMGPEAAKSFAGSELVRALSMPAALAAQPAERATQENNYGRHGKGYIFGAFQPATGEALTQPYGRRTTANWIDSQERLAPVGQLRQKA